MIVRLHTHELAKALEYLHLYRTSHLCAPSYIEFKVLDPNPLINDLNSLGFSAIGPEKCCQRNCTCHVVTPQTEGNSN